MGGIKETEEIKMLERWMIQELINLVWNEEGRCNGVVKEFKDLLDKGVDIGSDGMARYEYWVHERQTMSKLLKVLEKMD